MTNSRFLRRSARANYKLILSQSKTASSNLQLRDFLSNKQYICLNIFQMWFCFFFGLFSMWVLWENSEPMQTAFRASHGKAHGLGNLSFIVLCEEIILLCSLLLALASFIQCPLAQGSTELLLIYLFHPSHYFINHSNAFSSICPSGWGSIG